MTKMVEYTVYQHVVSSVGNLHVYHVAVQHHNYVGGKVIYLLFFNIFALTNKPKWVWYINQCIRILCICKMYCNMSV